MGYKRYYVYLLSNKRKTVLYTGMCNDLVRRAWEHKTGAVPGFTKKYNCDRLVHFEEFDEVTDTIVREKQIKGWTRAKKDALIAVRNPEWRDLAADWYNAESPGSFAVFAAQDDTGKETS
jgi:putative endonuclease